MIRSNDLPIVLMPSGVARTLLPFSVSVITGSSATTVTLPNPADVLNAGGPPPIYFVHNESSNTITFSTANGKSFSINNVAVGSYTLGPGRSAIIYCNGNFYDDLLSYPNTSFLAGTGNRSVYTTATGQLAAGSGFAGSTLFVSNSLKTVANTTTNTSIIPATGIGSMTLPANFFTPGKALILKGRGVYTDTAIAPTLTVTVKLGSVTLATGTVTALFGGAVNYGFSFEMMITCSTNGASGTFYADGSVPFQSTNTMGISALYLNNVATVGPIDTTVANLLDVQVQWSAASASNTITTNQVFLTSLVE